MMNNKFDNIDKLELELAIFVRRAEATRIAFLKYRDLNRSIYLLLLSIEKFGPISIKSLADQFQLDISTMSRQTSSLEAKGFIKRASDAKDARISLFEITTIGIEQLTEVKSERRLFYTEFLKDWSDEDKTQFTELLKKFNHTAENFKKNHKKT